MLTVCLFSEAVAHSPQGLGLIVCDRETIQWGFRFQWRAHAWQPTTLGHRGARCLIRKIGHFYGETRMLAKTVVPNAKHCSWG